MSAAATSAGPSGAAARSDGDGDGASAAPMPAPGREVYVRLRSGDGREFIVPKSLTDRSATITSMLAEHGHVFREAGAVLNVPASSSPGGRSAVHEGSDPGSGGGKKDDSD